MPGPQKACSTIKIHTPSPTQLGLRGSSRRSNGSGSQTLSPSPGPGSSPCVCDSNFLKNPQRAQHFSFYFYKHTTDPHHTHTHTPLLRNTEQSLAITAHPGVWCTVLSNSQQAHKGSRGSFFSPSTVFSLSLLFWDIKVHKETQEIDLPEMWITWNLLLNSRLILLGLRAIHTRTITIVT